MTTVGSYSATIYVGLMERESCLCHTLDEVKALCQHYVDEVGLCVTVTPTEFIYTGGGEPGAAVGLINYPRFPKDQERIRALTLDLAERLMEAMRQYRVSVVFPDDTVMLSNPEFNE